MSPEELLRQAAEVRERAYTPYSGYRVGAAVLAADGQVFLGANVENAAYDLARFGDAAAIVLADCFSLYGAVVVAK